MAFTNITITDEQKIEWIKKHIDFSKDVVKVQGRILLTAEASKRLAEKFKIPYVEGRLLNLSEVQGHIIKFESQAFFAQESMRRLNNAVDVIKGLVAEGKNDYQIAVGLYDSCEGNLRLIQNAVQQATKLKHLPPDNVVLSNIDKIVNKNTVEKNFSGEYNNATDVNQLADDLAQRMLKIFTSNGLDFGNLIVALRNSIPDEAVIEETLRLFYVKYEPYFMQKYANSTLSDAALAQEVYNYYIKENFFDARVISEYVSRLNRESLNMDDFNYTLYCLDGEEHNVFEIVMLPGKTPEEIAQLLYEAEIQFPPICLKRTFDKLKGVNLPFDKILELYISKSVKVAGEEEADIQPVERPVATITADDEEFVDAAEEVVVEEAPEKAPLARRLKIKEKKAEKTEFGRKKTLGIILIAAGLLPTIVLSWQFKVDPAIAARNCAMALEQLASGSMEIKDLLPSPGQLTALLAGMATSFVGLVTFLRNKKKKKNVEAEIAEIGTGSLDDELEVELERELTSDTPGKRGGKRK